VFTLRQQKGIHQYLLIAVKTSRSVALRLHSAAADIDPRAIDTARHCT
jgi:hypothetical protein